ncbi:sugar MFS transporter [Methylomicrobium sp. Wu6]|uniref:sugar MFS transporter n=1 Tax=Methylomicrobium sp. Wu6 TaxID=3107928 RepID=UPI002DD69539|nr:sugar MFS transporter [Methylomicrobium sp. Wu6]MEC4748488.1 sugar MFS transporter [Methylomicrobium sp. Wu6]
MSSKNPYFGSLSILTSLFFMWGFVTCLNDILIPHLKSLFILNYTQVMLVQFCFFAAYPIVSVPSGYFVERFNYQAGIITGLTLASIGCLLFYPAAELLCYPLFLAAFFVLASGITLLQVSANPYVTILGQPETASGRLTLTQAFNSLGTTLAPYFGGLLILTIPVKTIDELKSLNAEALAAYQSTQAKLVQLPYLGLAGTLLLIALIFAWIKLPNIAPAVIERNNTELQVNGNKNAWHYRHLILGALGIFVYVGAEVAIGSFLISYLGEPHVAGLSAQAASKYVSFYWGGAMLGRFVGAPLMQYISAGKLLTFNALSATLLVLIAMLGSGLIAMWSLLAIGLFNSIMFPTIFSLAFNGLGKHTGQGSGILCTAIVGGAILPAIQGVFADRIGLQLAFFIPALCYCYIAYYGWRGSRLNIFYQTGERER